MADTRQQPMAGRSADELNARIRALMLRSGGVLSAEQRKEYEELLTAWAQATRHS
ncbi:hypothetical protein GCM10010277_81010 [Streptomyces longisporoflavus]|uniref:hypothetical protein n=1 Tax=Streptomyces longisporoflavus TaxID=28044 RepID=UPI00167EE908|nr:hypothetical protein [Streptomyces longisporoflavus]GGV70221.1 hypothetical protein GCM10010277_81010 [Streptomyces longisporoflavus]